MQTITCPHCNTLFELSEALDTEYKESLTAALEKKHKDELEKTRLQALEDSTKRIKDQFETQMKRAQDDAQAKDERIKDLIEQITLLTKEVRESKKEKDEVKLTMQKQLAEEEEKIRADAQKKAEEEGKILLLQKDKQLQDALKEAEDMKRRLQQGSQQLQGEAFELEFETLLARQYPNDKILPVGKGIKGGDIIQEVWDKNGHFVGKILWELKNTKTWSELWVDKLKTDKRAITADEAILISEVLPNELRTAGYRNGIWVTERTFVIPLADTMRAKLIQLYQAKMAAEGKDTKMEILYRYLSGAEFKNRVEAIIEAFSAMQVEIEKEKRYFSNKWARDEKNIRQVVDSTYGMHGDLRGIIGGMLPQIQGLGEDAIALESSVHTPND